MRDGDIYIYIYIYVHYIVTENGFSPYEIARNVFIYLSIGFRVSFFIDRYYRDLYVHRTFGTRNLESQKRSRIEYELAKSSKRLALSTNDRGRGGWCFYRPLLLSVFRGLNRFDSVSSVRQTGNGYRSNRMDTGTQRTVESSF